MSYIASYGDKIFDVLLNTTGSFSQLSDILKKNKMTTYTPVLSQGQEIETDGLIEENNRVLLRASESAYSSVALSDDDFGTQVKELDDILSPAPEEPEYGTLTIDQSGDNPVFTVDDPKNHIGRIYDSFTQYFAKYNKSENKFVICKAKAGSNFSTLYDGTPAGNWGLYGELFVKPTVFSMYSENMDDSSNIIKVKFAFNQEVKGWDVWGDDLMIGYTFARVYNNVDGYTVEGTSREMLFSQAEEILSRRGPGFLASTFAMRSVMSALYLAVNKTVNFIADSLNVSSFLGDWQEFVGGINISNEVATVTALDGTTYQRKIDIQGWISKIVGGAHFNIVPLECNATQNTGYKSWNWKPNESIISVRVKAGMYGHNELFGIGYDSNKVAKCRAAFKGRIEETTDTNYFLSLPVE